MLRRERGAETGAQDAKLLFVSFPLLMQLCGAQLVVNCYHLCVTEILTMWLVVNCYHLCVTEILTVWLADL